MESYALRNYRCVTPGFNVCVVYELDSRAGLVDAYRADSVSHLHAGDLCGRLLAFYLNLYFLDLNPKGCGFVLDTGLIFKFEIRLFRQIHDFPSKDRYFFPSFPKQLFFVLALALILILECCDKIY